VAEHRRVDVIGQIHPIQEQQVEVHVQVQRRAEALHQRYRAEHQRQRTRMGRQQKPQRVRQRQHPLPQRMLGQHLIGQPRGGLGHASCAARRAESALLATECDQLVGVTGHAAHALEALLQSAALQVGLELLLYEGRQRPPDLGA
jgi:hypothetical protein